MSASPREYWVDGYNLIHRRRWALVGGLEAARSRLFSALGSLTVRVRVFFDASNGSGPGSPDTVDRGPVQVTFVREGTADDAMIAALRIQGGPGVALVTDDRELRQRAQQLGALTVGVNRFLERLDRSPTTARERPAGPRDRGAAPGRDAEGRPRSVSKKDVDDWMREFGLDDPDAAFDLDDLDDLPPRAPTR